MHIRSNMLPVNQSAGRLELTPRRTVHHRPPKKIAPSKMPATNANAKLNGSFITVLLLLVYFPVFLGHPMPRIEATEPQSDGQQHERPGTAPWIAIVQPDSECRAEQRRHHHRPSNQAHHAQSRPHDMRDMTLGLEFSRLLLAHLKAEFRLARCRFSFWFFTHDETTLNDEQIRPRISPIPNARFSPARPDSETPALPSRAVFLCPFPRSHCARRPARRRRF